MCIIFLQERSLYGLFHSPGNVRTEVIVLPESNATQDWHLQLPQLHSNVMNDVADSLLVVFASSVSPQLMLSNVVSFSVSTDQLLLFLFY